MLGNQLIIELTSIYFEEHQSYIQIPDDQRTSNAIQTAETPEIHTTSHDTTSRSSQLRWLQNDRTID